MRLIKLNTQPIRHGLALFCVIFLLNSCGLGKGHGNLDDGAKYQASGQYRAAYIEAKKVLQRDSTNGNAWLLLGQASLMLGNPTDALSELEKAKTNGAPEVRWEVPLGRALLVTQQYDKLLKTLSADKSFEPRVKAHVQALRGDAYRGLKQNDQAQQEYKAALTSDPENPNALVGLAKLAAVSKDQASADRYLQQALAAAPENPQAWIAKGDLAFDSNDFAAAESDYQKVLGFKNVDWVPQEHFYTLSRLASVQVKQGKMDKALVSIQMLEKMSPQHPYPHYLHAAVLYNQSHLDDAVSELQQVLKVSPDSSQAQMLMGAINYAQGNYGQAEMYLSNVMGTDSKNVKARKLLALTLYREGRSRQALDLLRPAVPGTPSDTELVAMLQRAAAAGTDTRTAVEPTASSEKAPARTTATGSGNPLDNVFAGASKALASGNATEAIRLLEKIPPGDAATEARRAPLLAMAYVRAQRPDEAVKMAAEYVKTNPRSSIAHQVYGTTLVAVGQSAGALAQYAEAYKLDPKNLEALLNMGSLDTLERRYKDATGRYEAVLKQDPRNNVAMTALARLAVLQGEKAEAAKWFKQAINVAPGSLAANIGLVGFYSQSGQFDEAVDVARQFSDHNPNNPVALDALGAAQLNAGHYKEALKPLQQAVTLAPQVTLFRTNLARAQILDKDIEAAKDNLDKVIQADPAQVTAVTLRSFMKLQNHDLAGALALAKTLQARTATKAAGFALEGDLYLTDKSWGKAANAYKQALKITYERPLVIKSFQALKEGGFQQPEGILRDWLTKHSDDNATRLLLAQYYMDHAQNSLAASQYELVLKAYPANVDALNNLAWIYIEQRNPKALVLAERAYKSAPHSPGVADTYAWALIADHQPKTALPILVTAAQAAPKVPAIQYHLAVAQARTGDKTGARSTLEALEKSGADFQNKPAAKQLYLELGRESDRSPGG